jgi:hypothetical protein
VSVQCSYLISFVSDSDFDLARHAFSSKNNPKPFELLLHDALAVEGLSILIQSICIYSEICTLFSNLKTVAAGF